MQALDPTLMGLTMALTQVSRAYKSAADKVAGDFGLSQASAWPVIMIGRLGDGVRPGALAEALGLEPPSLVRVVDQLIEQGLIERQDDPTDRRAKTLHLTKSGHERATAIEKALIPFRRQLFAGIPRADIDACLRVLHGLGDAIAAQAES